MDQIYKNKPLVIITAPSGAGKTTLTRYLLEIYDVLKFSVSSTTRPIRWSEINGVDYHFIRLDQMEQKISDWKMLEREEVYPGNIYGTDKNELKKIRDTGHIPLLDIDVKGALNIKAIRPNILSIFISPPDINTLQNRLKERNTDTEENIKIRVDKANYEMNYADSFDMKIINDDLNKAKKEISEVVWTRLEKINWIDG